LENPTAIIKGCMEKNYKCQKKLYDHYLGFAFKIAFRYMYRYEKAVDVVNDGFVKLFNHFPHFKLASETENEKVLLGFLKRIMINTSIDSLRKEQLTPEIGGIPETDWLIADHNSNADQSLLYKEIIILIKELPPNYRIVFNLYVIDGYSHQEIAELMHISIGTSKSALSRAKKLLRDRIKIIEDVKLCRI
jgi:RNA polymerase sigma factor (sigma-70 family)